MRKLLIALCALALLFVTACSTVPETGRTTLMLLSVEEEQQLGTDSYRQILAESKLSQNATYNARLDAVAKRIIGAVGGDMAASTPWEYHVIEDEQVNAFALPGGKIAVYSGLMKMATDEELAFVIAHEVAHITARHGAERMSQETVVSLVGAVLGSSISSQGGQALFQVAYGLGTQVGVTLPHSRKNEYEADEIGTLYAARAGYNPQGCISMLQKLSELSGGNSTPEWLSTHPIDENRIARVNTLLPARMEEYNRSKK